MSRIALYDENDRVSAVDLLLGVSRGQIGARSPEAIQINKGPPSILAVLEGPSRPRQFSGVGSMIRFVLPRSIDW